MIWLFLFIITIFVVELFNLLPVAQTIRELIVVVAKVQKVIASPSISDCWKEKVLLRYAGQIFFNSVKVFGLMLVCFSPALVVAGFADVFSWKIYPLLTSLEGLLASSFFAIGYGFFRLKIAR